MYKFTNSKDRANNIYAATAFLAVCCGGLILDWDPEELFSPIALFFIFGLLSCIFVIVQYWNDEKSIASSRSLDSLVIKESNKEISVQVGDIGSIKIDEIGTGFLIVLNDGQKFKIDSDFWIDPDSATPEELSLFR